MMQPNLKSFQEERRRWGDLEQQPLSYSLKRARKGLGSGGGGEVRPKASGELCQLSCKEIVF